MKSFFFVQPGAGGGVHLAVFRPAGAAHYAVAVADARAANSAPRLLPPRRALHVCASLLLTVCVDHVLNQGQVPLLMG